MEQTQLVSYPREANCLGRINTIDEERHLVSPCRNVRSVEDFIHQSSRHYAAPAMVIGKGGEFVDQWFALGPR